jgi:hypothetical protein
MFLGVVSIQSAEVCEVGTGGDCMGDGLVFGSSLLGFRGRQAIEDLSRSVVAESYDGLRKAQCDDADEDFEGDKDE